jgi:hypothetical protein
LNKQAFLTVLALKKNSLYDGQSKIKNEFPLLLFFIIFSQKTLTSNYSSRVFLNLRFLFSIFHVFFIFSFRFPIFLFKSHSVCEMVPLSNTNFYATSAKFSTSSPVKPYVDWHFNFNVRVISIFFLFL